MKTQIAWIKKQRTTAIQGRARQVVLEEISRWLGYFSAAAAAAGD
jgi:hypothetical protein